MRQRFNSLNFTRFTAAFAAILRAKMRIVDLLCEENQTYAKEFETQWVDVGTTSEDEENDEENQEEEPFDLDDPTRVPV